MQSVRSAAPDGFVQSPVPEAESLVTTRGSGYHLLPGWSAIQDLVDINYLD